VTIYIPTLLIFKEKQLFCLILRVKWLLGLTIAIHNIYVGSELNIVGPEVLTAVIMKRSIFWDITQCSPIKVSRRFGGICAPSSESENKSSKKPA
jgi:hypothetical protein